MNLLDYRIPNLVGIGKYKGYDMMVLDRLGEDHDIKMEKHGISSRLKASKLRGITSDVVKIIGSNKKSNYIDSTSTKTKIISFCSTH